jgi:hypothetical protein
MKIDVGFSRTEKTSYLLPAITLTIAIGIWLIGKKLYLAQNLGVKSIQIEEKVAVLTLIDIALKDHAAPSIAILSLVIFSMVFILAHCIETASEYIFEILLVNKLQGHAHERLVPIQYTTPRYVEFRKNFPTREGSFLFMYEGIKALIFLLLFGPFLILFDRYCTIIDYQFLFNHFIVDAVFLWIKISTATITIIIVIFLYGRYSPKFRNKSTKTREDKIEKYLYKSFSNKSIKKTLAVSNWLFLIGIWTYGYDIIDRICRSFFQLNKEIDEETYLKAKFFIESSTNLNIEKIKSNDRLWIPYLLITSKKNEMLGEIHHFESRSKFYRNQALALFLSSALIAGSFSLEHELKLIFFTKGDLMHISLSLFFLAILFVGRFYQINYSSGKTIYRACAILTNQK